MELATGRVRYEFSGPAAAGWYAPFLPDGRGFLASRLFQGGVALWPTDPRGADERPVPKPKVVLEGFPRSPESAAVSGLGHVAFALDGGDVVLRDLEGGVLPLTPHAGAGPSSVVFTPSGRHLVALRAGRLFAWSLPEPKRAAPAVPATTAR